MRKYNGLMGRASSITKQYRKWRKKTNKMKAASRRLNQRRK